MGTTGVTMVDVQSENDIYRTDLDRLETGIGANGGDSPWLSGIRKAAIERFEALGFPTTRHEEWRNTNVGPIAKRGYRLADANGAALTAADLAEAAGWDTGIGRLVFVNGRYAPHLSTVGSLPDGVVVGSLAEATAAGDSAVKSHLARHAPYDEHAFCALNTAFLSDGAWLHIPRSTCLDSPIHVVFIAHPQGEGQVTHPRCLIVAEPNSQATIIESHIGLGDGAGWTNAVTEIVVGENAVLEHTKLIREAESACHIGFVQLTQLRDSTVTLYIVPTDGGLIRNDINVLLDGEGCDCTLNGLYVLRGRQHVDNHLRVEHAKPNCNSREFFKGVLDDQSRGVFSGRIIVRQDAQKTDAKQTNMNLLLSEDARVDAHPQLEIFADDVKCTHGATIGQLDEEALFYLRSRGISKAAAHSLLVYAFARESLDKVRPESLRKELEAWLLSRLPQGESLQEAI